MKSNLRRVVGQRLGMLLAMGLFTSPATSHASDVLAGMATGYPPYQFQQDGQLAGFDVAVARAVFEQLNEPLSLSQYEWDNVVSLLRYDELDVAIGMESTAVRRQYFDFSTAYYARQTGLFIITDDTTKQTVRDLIGKRISGDRHSALEAHLKKLGLRQAIRIEQADSKAEAMSQLAVGEVEAVIMPKRVAMYLAKQNGIDIRPLWTTSEKTPVGFAVAKGNNELLDKINQALSTLEQSGRLNSLRDRWNVTP